MESSAIVPYLVDQELFCGLSPVDSARIKALPGFGRSSFAGHISSVLDLGCGVPDGREHAILGGSTCHSYHEAGWQVTGVDVLPWSGPLPEWRFIQGDLTNMAFLNSLATGTFDLIISRFFVSDRVHEISPSLVLNYGLKPHLELRDAELKANPEYRDFLRAFFNAALDRLKLGGLFAWNDRHLLVKERDGFQPYEKGDRSLFWL